MTRPWAGLTALALVLGIPFAAGLPLAWEGAGLPLLGGTLALAVAAFRALAVSYSIRDALAYLGLSFSLAWGAETMGVQAGWLFGGRYHYHPALQPVLPGGVPIFIPLAWFVLSCVPLILLRSLAVRGKDGAIRPSRLAARAALTGVFLAGCDLALDPIATSLGAWAWEKPGPYYGTPWLNFLGWGALGATIALIALGPLAVGRRREAASPPPWFNASWLAGSVSLLAYLALAARSHVPDGLPLGLSLLVIGPYWIYWLVRRSPLARSEAAALACWGPIPAGAGGGSPAAASFSDRLVSTRTNSSSLISPTPGA